MYRGGLYGDVKLPVFLVREKIRAYQRDEGSGSQTAGNNTADDSVILDNKDFTLYAVYDNTFMRAWL